MTRRNRVDPFGDLHAVVERGMLTGNRGCLVDDDRRLVRHHRGNLWISCVTNFRGWHQPLDARPCLVVGSVARPFGFSGWGPGRLVDSSRTVTVLTPRLSVAALAHGYTPTFTPLR